MIIEDPFGCARDDGSRLVAPKFPKLRYILRFTICTVLALVSVIYLGSKFDLSSSCYIQPIMGVVTKRTAHSSMLISPLIGGL